MQSGLLSQENIVFSQKSVVGGGGGSRDMKRSSGTGSRAVAIRARRGLWWTGQEGLFRSEREEGEQNRFRQTQTPCGAAPANAPGPGPLTQKTTVGPGSTRPSKAGTVPGSGRGPGL